MVNELDWRTYDSAAEKAKKLAEKPGISKYEKERRLNQASSLGGNAINACDKQYGIDKINKRESDYYAEAMRNGTKEPFKHTNGELKRLDRQSNDVRDYYGGKQEYRDGKWLNKESKEVNGMTKKIIRLTESDLHNLIENAVKKYLNEWMFSPEQLDDKAYMDDYYDQRQKLMNDEWERKNIAIRKKYPGKSREWYEAMLDTFYEGKENEKASINEMGEPFQNNQNYTHFAVNKTTNKIVNGWDYAEYDPEELRQFKRDYFIQDLIDYDLNPKQYKIVTSKYLLRQGIDPNDNHNWANQ